MTALKIPRQSLEVICKQRGYSSRHFLSRLQVSSPKQVNPSIRYVSGILIIRFRPALWCKRPGTCEQSRIVGAVARMPRASGTAIRIQATIDSTPIGVFRMVGPAGSRNRDLSPGTRDSRIEQRKQLRRVANVHCGTSRLRMADHSLATSFATGSTQPATGLV